ncbi:MAG: YihY/virulence factor BrkB family protein [Opitutaceae bacterium]
MDQTAPGKEWAAPDDANEPGRGRHADKPTEVPAQGWLDILTRTKDQLSEDNLSIVAAGVAFYAFVAVVPALGALIGIYALVADAGQIAEHISVLARVVPGEVMPLLEDQLKRLTADDEAAGWSAALGLLLAIYSSSAATKALITGINIAYDENEKRGFFKLNVMALGLTLFILVGAVIAVGLVAVLPGMVEHLRISTKAETLLSWLRWPVLLIGFMLGLAAFYRFGPSRHNAKWKWVSWGAGVGALFWLAGSALFSLYVVKLGSYDKTYGSLGAVVVFLLWLFITAYAVLVGAELNSEMERQTLKDTTEGPEKPMGTRGAAAADTVGPSRDRKGPRVMQ